MTTAYISYIFDKSTERGVVLLYYLAVIPRINVTGLQSSNERTYKEPCSFFFSTSTLVKCDAQREVSFDDEMLYL